MVLMDPDNWLLKDLTAEARLVSRGHSVANAAWYSQGGRPKMEQLWALLCDEPADEAACAGQLVAPLALAAVPYLVHRDGGRERVRARARARAFSISVTNKREPV